MLSKLSFPATHLYASSNLLKIYNLNDTVLLMKETPYHHSFDEKNIHTASEKGVCISSTDFLNAPIKISDKFEKKIRDLDNAFKDDDNSLYKEALRKYRKALVETQKKYHELQESKYLGLSSL